MNVPDLPDELVATSVWSDSVVEGVGFPIRDVPIVSVGGGLGSFALADTLRISGAPIGQLRVSTNLERPYETYRYLCRASQIPDDERLRSDSGSTIDCIWGWPGYALRESAHDRGQPGWLDATLQVLVEPLFTDFYTPRAGHVYASIDRECARIGWASILVRGRVRMVRRRQEGGYFTVLTPADGSSRRLLLRSRHVHLAVGYPGARFLPDLQDFIDRHGDLGRIVNAYAQHEGVYQQLRATGGTVLVRGSGIVASRVLQRLMDDVEQHGAETQIVHLFRNYVDSPQGDSAVFRRDGGHGFAYQGFNWPKAAWGGQTKVLLEQVTPKQRAELLQAMGGTNTPKRGYWRRQLARARAGGYYTTAVGEVSSLEPAPAGGLDVSWEGPAGVTSRHVDFIVDATGLIGDISEHRVLADLLEHTAAGRNPLGRLDVADSFEVRGTRSGNGRLYASGAATLGGPYAGVDSFLGLQYAALWIADDLARHGAVPRLTPLRSVVGWWRWARNKPIRG